VQLTIWAEATAATRAQPTTAPAMLLLPALNQMFDIASTRKAAMRAHMPTIVFGLLIFLVLCCSVLAGYGMTDAGPRNWLHSFAFAAVFLVTLYVIVDYEFPRWGVINLKAQDQPMLEVRQSMVP
jgi:membrane protein YdbS with pleckstrin-like domain